ncbi:diacylglycerol/lipid kinase family protein [Legionella sp. D16C41]|uniref:diacylglycerol/lipid kinase family protein n=1 Tax=Legionella sp. D16C41 TaxID=3402688 RepID=UPI003AF44EE5
MIYIFINTTSAGQAALKKWRQVELILQEQAINYRPIFTAGIAELTQQLKEIATLQTSETAHIQLVSAGGDGSLHTLINKIFQIFSEPQRKRIKLGAINLGSSNDFHKPYHKLLKGHSLRMSTQSTAYDVGRCRMINETGESKETLFLVNASIGLTAQGNYIFNTNPIVQHFKKINFNVANFCTLLLLLKNISHQQFFLELITSEGETIVFDEIMSNMGILKTPNVSGGMNFGTPVQRNDRLLDFVFTKKINIGQLFSLFIKLHKGAFLNDKNSGFHSINSIKVSSLTPFLLEMDGEIMEPVREAFFDLHPQTIQVCEAL